ncbi:MAG: flagellar biosynthetic protein FliR [Rhodobacteraceae bacterium]|nr:flagellar biosynthetic protein FliR [Paracoccaceae bacterium]
MIGLPPEILDWLSDAFRHGFLVFLRVSALVSLLPAFGERSVPVRVKLILAIAFSAIVAPAAPFLTLTGGPLEFVGFVLPEITIGLVLGIAIRLFILALQTAGSIAAQATSLSQLLGGAAAEPVPAMGYVLVVAALALAVMFGLHIRAAELLILSYELFPAGVFPDGRLLSSWGLSRISHAFSLAFMLAAPFVIASLVYNLTLGVINRAMPQLMVAFVGAPLITFGGLFLLFVSTPFMLTVWIEALSVFFQNPAGASR